MPVQTRRTKDLPQSEPADIPTAANTVDNVKPANKATDKSSKKVQKAQKVQKVKKVKVKKTPAKKRKTGVELQEKLRRVSRIQLDSAADYADNSTPGAPPKPKETEGG